jgi:hypothetical protein
MKRYALLIGISEYDNDAFPNLDVARRDITALSDALKRHGYNTHLIGTGNDQTGRSDVIYEIRSVLREVPDDGTLLIYFSAHGLHYDDASYIVPSDCRSPDEDPAGLDNYLIPVTLSTMKIDVGGRQLLTVVDACRDGLRLRHKSPNDYIELWTANETQEALSKVEGRLFGCTKGERCGYSKTTEGLSYFTQAFINTVNAEQSVTELSAFAATVQAELTRLTQDEGAAPQTVHFEASAAAGEATNPWFSEIVPNPHPAPSIVELITEADGREDGADPSELVAGVKAAMSLAPMPTSQRWLSADFDERLAYNVRRLVHAGNGRSAMLTIPEAYVLGLACIARSRFVAKAGDKLAEAIGSEHGTTRSGSAARASFPSLSRKLDRLAISDAPARSDLIRWLAERRAIDWRDTYEDDQVRADLRAQLEILERAPGRLDALVETVVLLARSVAVDVRALASFESELPETMALGTNDWGFLRFRPRRLAYMLATAGAMTPDPRLLSEVVPAHLGLSDGITAEGLLTTISEIGWVPTQVGWDLDLRCPHPAIDKALREWIDRANELLAHIGQHGWEETASRLFPERLSTEELRATVEGGTASYELPHVTFRLSTEETRELLMGTELYGDPSLAYRELYQNALDACRYRQVRMQYLAARGTLTNTDWVGRIEFHVGEDETGPYVECRDNGIGMARTQFDRTFARAGVRFQDLPEFAEELHAWRRALPDLTWTPNSRFGIGVFSYFMVADEIHVQTSRLSSAGQPQSSMLDVSIAGSGSLFRVRQVPNLLHTSGTTVRLYLSGTAATDPKACERTLASLLRIVEFETVLHDGLHSLTWSPNATYAGGVRINSQQGTNPRVWWIDGPSHAVVDGIATEPLTSMDTRSARGHHYKSLDARRRASAVERLTRPRSSPGYGCLVNFGGSLNVQLSVDRRTIRGMPEDAIAAAIAESVHALPAWSGLTWDWLWTQEANLELRCSIEDVLSAAEIAPRCVAWDVPQASVRTIGVAIGDFDLLDDFDSNEVAQSWFAANRVALWLAAGAELEEDTANVVDALIPESLDSYPWTGAAEELVHEAPSLSTGPLAELLDYAILRGLTFGEALRSVRHHSMLGGPRPRLVGRNLSDAAPGSELWQVLRLIWPSITERFVVELHTADEPLLIEELALDENTILESVAGAEAAPSEIMKQIRRLGGQGPWAEGKSPPWAKLTRPLSQAEQAILSRDGDEDAPWHTPDLETFVGRVGTGVYTHDAEVLVRAYSTLSGETHEILDILAVAREPKELRLTAQIASVSMGWRREQDEFPYQGVDGNDPYTDERQDLIALWTQLATEHPQIFTSPTSLVPKTPGRYIILGQEPESQAVREAVTVDVLGYDQFLAPHVLSLLAIARAASEAGMTGRALGREVDNYYALNGYETSFAAKLPDVAPPAWLFEESEESLAFAGVAGIARLVRRARGERTTPRAIVELVASFGNAEAMLALDDMPPAARDVIPEGLAIDASLLFAEQLRESMPLLPKLASLARQMGASFRTVVEGLGRIYNLDAAEALRSSAGGDFIPQQRHVLALSADLDCQAPTVRDFDGQHLLRVAGRLGVPLGTAQSLLMDLVPFGFTPPPAISADLEAEIPSWTDLCVLSDAFDEVEIEPSADLGGVAVRLALANRLDVEDVRGRLTKYAAVLPEQLQG